MTTIFLRNEHKTIIYKNRYPKDKVNSKALKYKEKINKEDNFFQGPNEECDLSDLMKKWKSQLNKFDLKETLSLVYAKESKLIKRDLDRNIKIINENIHILGSSDGFKLVGQQLGFDNDKMITNRKEPILTPHLIQKNKSCSYIQLKEMRNQEKEEKNKLIEQGFLKVKQIEESRNAKINWMKDRVKYKEIKDKLQEEVELK